MIKKSSQLVIRLTPYQKDTLRSLANEAGISMANYIITKLRLDKKAT
jgi:predicted HicB family RNase H-like nuclease